MPSAERSCSVEFLGPARLLAGRKELRVVIDRDAVTLGELLGRLAAECPPLVGPVLRPDGRAVADGYICSLNGRSFVADPQTCIRAGERLLLLASSAGG